MKQPASFLILFFLSAFIFQSCESDCGACFTPPSPFHFVFIDKTSGENVFTNGIYKPADIKIFNEFDSSNVEFNFIDENNSNIVEINTIGWKTERVNISVLLANKHIFNLYVDAERLFDNCCSYTLYNEIRIDSAEYEFNQDTAFYRVLIE